MGARRLADLHCRMIDDTAELIRDHRHRRTGGQHRPSLSLSAPSRLELENIRSMDKLTPRYRPMGAR